PKVLRYALGQFQVDIGQDFIDLPGTNELTLDLAQLEAVGRNDVLLFVLAHAVEKQPRLGEMVAERFAALTDLVGVDALRIALETAVLCGGRRFFRPAAINGIRFVGCTALIDGGAMPRIPLAAVKRCYRTVDLYLMKVRPAESADLR